METTNSNVATTQKTARAPRSNTRKTATASSPTTSKSAQAFTIFKRLHGKKARKDVVQEFIDKVGLVPSSANTYYQKFLQGSNTPSKGSKRTAAKSTGSSRGRPIDESSKAGIARALFKKMSKRPRKDVIDQLMVQAKLTPAGASTYYQKMKQAA